MRHHFALTVVFPWLLAGCSLPTPDYLEKPAGKTSPSVSDLNNHIRCEIEKTEGFDALKKDGYVAQITLSLKVEDNGGLTPNLSFITGAGHGGVFNYALDGNLNLDREQIYSTSYVLDLQTMSNDGKDCPSTEGGMARSLSGDLGIDRISSAGISEIDQQSFNLKVKPPGGVFDQSSQYPNFGSTVQFILTYGFDTGPSWTLINFKGPNGSKGLLNGGRIYTDNLIIAFASAPRAANLEELEQRFTKAKIARDKAVADAKKRGTGSLKAQSLPAVRAASGRVTAAQANLDRARDARAEGASAAVYNAQAFTNAIILQNLTGNLH